MCLWWNIYVYIYLIADGNGSLGLISMSRLMMEQSVLDFPQHLMPSLSDRPAIWQLRSLCVHPTDTSHLSSRDGNQEDSQV